MNVFLIVLIQLSALLAIDDFKNSVENLSKFFVFGFEEVFNLSWSYGIKIGFQLDQKHFFTIFCKRNVVDFL